MATAIASYHHRTNHRIVTPKGVEVPPLLTGMPLVRRQLAKYLHAIRRMDQGAGLVPDAVVR